jgi:hypothetical protein
MERKMMRAIKERAERTWRAGLHRAASLDSIALSRTEPTDQSGDY